MHPVCFHSSDSAASSSVSLLHWVLSGIFLFSVQTGYPQANTINGRVVDTYGVPVNDAVVRIPAENIYVYTDPDGIFQISVSPEMKTSRVTAWKEGYYISGTQQSRNNDSVRIMLTRHLREDNDEYQWLEPKIESRRPIQNTTASVRLYLANTKPFRSLFDHLNKTMELGCVDCHGTKMYEEWFNGAHAAGNKNLRFMSMYNGTDIFGNKSPDSRFHISRDYGASPLPARQEDNYYGPGYKLDFPFASGNCAACHLPGAAIDRPYDTDPNDVVGVNSKGSHCDLCHKISDVKLDPKSNMPYENRPGVLSYSFIRPDREQQIFFGPYDDVDAGTDVCLPLISRSEYCAGCHEASFWDVPVYKSYSEWYQSPYREKGITCQSCHMKPDGYTTNFARNRGGLERDPGTIPTHRFEGSTDSDLLGHAVTLHVQPCLVNSELNLQVVVDNNLTGHHVPTDSPLRQVILLVQIEDASGRERELISGPTIPAWGGEGDPADGNFAGSPGKIYSKVLEELWTGESPSGSYWMPTRIVSDNRIEAFHTDSSLYRLSLPEGDTVYVNVQLIYRRAPKKLMKQKKWDSPDILMNQYQGVYRRYEQKLMTLENSKL